jgi:serine protease Do
MKRHVSSTLWTCLLGLSLLSNTLRASELPDFTELIEKYSPAVVNISTTAKPSTDVQAPDDSEEMPGLPKNMPFDEFFRHFFEDNGEWSEPSPTTSLGSGFIISADGYVVTNNHVTENANEIIVALSDRREFEAKLIGADKRTDIALLKIEATDLPTIQLGASKDLKVGEWVVAIGSPFGFEYSATAGIVSAKGRSLPSDNYVPFIQTDVAINPGNSGGPLFDMKGTVVGVNSQIYSRTGGFMGLSFAIPVDVMKVVIDQLKESGKVSRGWLGVLIQDVTRDLAESFNMEKPQGALVAQILPNSPAESAEFKVGDIIVEFNGKRVEHSSDLPPIVGMTPVESKVPVKVLRQGETVTLQVTIAELPSDDELELAATSGSSGKSTTHTTLGLSVTELTDEQRETLNLPVKNGVLVEKVSAAGPASNAGILKSDVITMINNVDIASTSQFKEVAESLQPGQTVPILIYRGSTPRFLALKMPKK